MSIETPWHSPKSRRPRARRLSLASCALSALLLGLPGAVGAEPAERVPLVFSEVERGLLGTYQYFSFVYDVPLQAQTEVSLTNLQPRMRTQRSPHAEARWLKNYTWKVAALLEPSNGRQDAGIGRAWMNELYEESRYRRLFTESIMAAIAAAPAVFDCRYFLADKLPAELRDYAGNLSSFWSVSLAFWAGPVPDAIAPEALRAFRDPEEGMHPLIVIGPPIAACPESLGLALEVMATQFPGQVPAAKAIASVEPEEAGYVSSGEPSEDLIARLTGMSLAVTQTPPSSGWGAGDYLVIDRLDPDGPAARAGFRSGDYVRMISWTHHSTIDSFAAELASAEARKAAVLSRGLPRIFEHKAALVVFADGTPGEMIEMPRGASARGPTTLVAAKSWQTISVADEAWCAPHVKAIDALDIRATDIVPQSAGEAYAYAIARIKEECPEAETVSILRISSQVGAPIHVMRATLGSRTPMQRLGIDGLPAGASAAETRAIALDQAPLCDRLASHPSDPMRRYGLEGVAVLDESDLEAAFKACLAAVDANADDFVSRFHLGRVLHASGLYEEALDALRIAADAGHGGALDLLGEMHLLGEGVQPDQNAARRFFEAAGAAGFSRRSSTDPAVIDLSGVPLHDPVREVFDLGGSMYLAMLGENRVRSAYLEPDLRAYLVQMLVEIAILCGAETSLDTLRAARSSGFENPRDVDHALFLFAEHLPSLMPEVLSRYPATRYPSEGSQQSVSALVDRYNCLSPQLRQYTINASEMALR